MRSFYNPFLIWIALAPAVVCSAAKPAATSAFAEVSPNYERVRLDSGRYQPETYAFGEGILFDRSGKDPSLTSLTFREMATIIAEALLEADYVPTPSPEETDLLIVLSWGKTMPQDDGLGSIARNGLSEAMNSMTQLSQLGAGESDAAASMQSELEGRLDQMLMLQDMAEQQRRRANAMNAQLLGYHRSLRHATELMQTFAPMRSVHDDLMLELESPRYFVILQAYNFQKWFQDGTRVMLWSTRFSIHAKGRRFDEELRNMALASSRVMGTDSKRLQRHLRPARVEFGELEFLGVEDK